MFVWARAVGGKCLNRVRWRSCCGVWFPSHMQPGVHTACVMQRFCVMRCDAVLTGVGLNAQRTKQCTASVVDLPFELVGSILKSGNL